jgi:hypothetical protein
MLRIRVNQSEGFSDVAVSRYHEHEGHNGQHFEQEPKHPGPDAFPRNLDLPARVRSPG